jgi:cytochrome oxidase assembly protein ShyY1
MYGTCQKINNQFYQSISMNIVTIAIIVSCLIIFMISAILGIGIYILRRQRWKKHYHSPISSVCAKQQAMPVPAISDYDNVTYDAFRVNVQLSSSDDNDSSPMTTSDECSYEPKIVYLGGEQQLTAIFA